MCIRKHEPCTGIFGIRGHPSGKIDGGIALSDMVWLLLCSKYVASFAKYAAKCALVSWGCSRVHDQIRRRSTSR